MIRKAALQDFDSVYLLVCELEETIFDAEKMKSIFRYLIESENHNVFVYEEQSQILGYLVLKTEPQLHHNGISAEIIEFCVSSKYRNKKIGSQLFHHAEAYAKKQGCVVFELTTNQKRKDAHRFYERQHMQQTHFKYTLPLKKESED